jgi:hypothetical protein
LFSFPWHLQTEFSELLLNHRLNYKSLLPTFALAAAMVACGSGDGDSGSANDAAQAQAAAADGAVKANLAVADGVYHLKSACAGNLTLDVFDAGASQGAAFIVFPHHGGKNQQFKVQAQSDGSASITAVHSNLVLDISDSSPAEGAKAIQWAWNGGAHQRWLIEPAGNGAGQYRILAKHSGKVLDAHKEAGSAAPASAAAAQQWTNYGACNQLWSFVAVSNTPLPVTPPVAPAPSAGERVTTIYAPFTGKLQNPDRGFYSTENLITSQVGGVVGQPDYAFLRRAGYTLIRVLVRLDDFRNGPISQAAIAQMNAGFANMRLRGLKAQLGFAYNFPSSWDVSNPPPDAPLSVVLSHLDQLQPVFQDNKDVIASLSRGFIGAWGEGHASSNGTDTAEAKQAVFDKLMAVVPSDRMIQLRTVLEMKASLPAQVDASTAHNQSAAARTGLINACFMVNDSDAGTYLPTDQISAQKEYLANASKYTLIGGETCEVPTTTRRDNCANARIELARYHFTYLNDQFYAPTIADWKANGCFDEIANKLGYRIELLRSSIAKSTKSGDALGVSIVLKNTGYAAPYNPRGMAIALRNTETLQIVWLPVMKARDKQLDPRMWLPEDGEITVAVAPVIPAGTPAGTYQVLLSLHDPIQALASKPEFSIRTANEGIWEAGSGWNKLTDAISITQQ